MGRNPVRARGCLPFSLPRRIVALDCADRVFHRRDRRRQSAGARHHLWLFRSRESALEFLATHGGGSRNLHRFARALVGRTFAANREIVGRSALAYTSVVNARLAAVFLLFAAFLPPAWASEKKEWVKLADSRYVENPDNDGDSFHVRAGDKEFTARLYYVDAPETNLRQGDRTHDQSLHFGITLDETMKAGEKAKQRTKELLQRPFVIWTRWATAGGRGRESRYYVIVETDGKASARYW